jgi:hypothetical protein
MPILRWRGVFRGWPSCRTGMGLLDRDAGAYRQRAHAHRIAARLIRRREQLRVAVATQNASAKCRQRDFAWAPCSRGNIALTRNSPADSNASIGRGVANPHQLTTQLTSH